MIGSTAELPGTERADVLVIEDLATLRMISDPLRLRLIEAMRGEPKTVKEVAAELDLPATKLYYHVRLLEEHGILRVAGTRIVSGIIERHYQTAALRLSIERELLGGGQPGGLDVALAVILDEARQDIHRGVIAGLIDPTRTTPGDGGLTLGRVWQRLTPQLADEFLRRFKALETEFATLAGQDNTGAEQHDYEILLGIFPRAPER
jgi:DNA-binding transcriptional ArsR family regulator